MRPNIPLTPPSSCHETSAFHMPLIQKPIPEQSIASPHYVCKAVPAGCQATAGSVARTVPSSVANLEVRFRSLSKRTTMRLLKQREQPTRSHSKEGQELLCAGRVHRADPRVSMGTGPPWSPLAMKDADNGRSSHHRYGRVSFEVPLPLISLSLTRSCCLSQPHP